MVIDLGVPQKNSSSAFKDVTEEEVAAHILKSEDYLRTSKMRMSLRRACKNKHELCTLWALTGKCVESCKFENASKIDCSNG